VNAYIVYKCNEDSNDMARLNIMKKLAHSLVVLKMEKRLLNTKIHKEIKLNKRHFLCIRKDLSSTLLRNNL